MPSPRLSAPALSALALSALMLSGGLFGCAASTAASPGAVTPAGDAVTVNVGSEVTPVQEPPKANLTEAEAARKKALEEAAKYGILGALSAGGEVGSLSSLFGDSSSFDDVSAVLGGTAVSGGVAGGIVGGGGLGLSGVGIGGGGSGGGSVSLGTLGRGSGLGSFGVGGMAGIPHNTMPGTAITVRGGGVVELGDATTLGLSPEAGARALRDKVYSIQACYLGALSRDPRAAGAVGLWIVVSRDGRVTHVTAASPTLADAEALSCLRKAFEGYFAGSPSQSSYGIIEATLVLRPAPKP